MMENTLTIKKKVTESTCGLMDADMKVDGTKANSTDLGCIKFWAKYLSTVFGRTESE